MSKALRTLGLLLCLQVSLGHNACTRWLPHEDKEVCCESCEPGYHLLGICGVDPAALCVACEDGTYSADPKSKRCERCRQCVGAQVHLEDCTPTSDTRCGCKEGLICGDEHCTFCIKRCGKGEEPYRRSCRPCLPGTFNDQIHQKCKMQRTRCPDSEEAVGKAGAFSDIKCNGTSLIHQTKSTEIIVAPGKSEMVVLAVVIGVSLMIFVIIIVVFMAVVKVTRRKKKVTLKTTIIRTPTDGPRTLIATEHSFHEAEQEQGNSDSTEQLIL